MNTIDTSALFEYMSSYKKSKVRCNMGRRRSVRRRMPGGATSWSWSLYIFERRFLRWPGVHTLPSSPHSRVALTTILAKDAKTTYLESSFFSPVSLRGPVVGREQAGPRRVPVGRGRGAARRHLRGRLRGQPAAWGRRPHDPVRCVHTNQYEERSRMTFNWVPRGVSCRDGRCFRGDFRSGRPHGWGVMLRPDGTVEHGNASHLN